ncbi:unnamed protein product [Adineta steineri]|uniref:Uncharacterized protein n=1 Tax=Adineta steineri TaxID=433720 RepID=A0A815CNW4_9BILA|nr:unnamed protein product [Adineta steineri]CAF1585387.1 unnamed protein product [Adineta steineri]
MCQLPTKNSFIDQSTNSQDQRNMVGFDARNKDSVARCYLCQICMLILRNPIQLLCGHRYCHSCLNIKEHSVVKCITCNAETTHDKIIVDRGCQNDMETLTILCCFCDWNGIFKDYEKHLCANQLNVTCQYCGKDFVDKNLSLQHQSECGKMTVDCPFKQYGCIEQFLRKDTHNHLLTEKHQNIMSSVLIESESYLMNIQNNQQLTSTVSNDQLNKTVDIILNSIEVLNDDTQQLSSQTTQAQWLLKDLTEDMSKLSTAVQETQSFTTGLTPNQQVLQQNMNSLKQEIEDYQSISCDGTLLWRITDVQKKMADAQSDKAPSIYSPPFYSSPNGYKMRARLYLYGDGTARTTHLSIFFVLMRGTYDALLQFPFNYKVTFCLYDQSDKQEHIIDSFRPDISSMSFQRPRTDMNIASGIPKFFSLTKLQQNNNSYIRDDTMFIKVMIHFREAPKTLLPYIFNINPGLPTTVQETMTQQEVEKQKQQSTVDTSVPATSSTTLNST